jgi:hypothetical protein
MDMRGFHPRVASIPGPQRLGTGGTLTLTRRGSLARTRTLQGACLPKRIPSVV